MQTGLAQMHFECKPQLHICAIDDYFLLSIENDPAWEHHKESFEKYVTWYFQTPPLSLLFLFDDQFPFLETWRVILALP